MASLLTEVKNSWVTAASTYRSMQGGDHSNKDGVRKNTLRFAATQRIWAQQWIFHHNPGGPSTITIRTNCKISALWLQQWQSSARSLSYSEVVEGPTGTDILKLFDELRKGESLLAVQLITGTNGRDTFLLQARVPSVSSPRSNGVRGRQTAEHDLIFCPRQAAMRQ